ncbi:fasciclin domain-containing protein [Pontibacter diazotrophicus]|uniref:Fasciclin domain-containing protein n=1 Tax=Pontibacter diazotrophicus TaxID=1400979 RepID=A0A3D8LIF9_9BACT|nr:fasciclin domain-containing protein [Pontibacter diazotrophicus]RDV17138.1 fasciclin domain-containing protein [Pontibacter diazotrophicus]
MKITVQHSILIAATAVFSYGCAGSETGTTITGTAVETQVTEDASGSQDPMDPDTDMSAERTGNNTVSADNTIGRNMNIVALVQQNPNLSTFLELIRASDLVTILESPAPYTVFAPTNEAFDALPAGTIESLKDPASKMELTRIIQAHVLPNRISSAEMQDNMPMVTAQGDEVVVTKNGSAITVGGAKVITPDVQASNGIVHVVDRVLIPPQNSND